MVNKENIMEEICEILSKVLSDVEVKTWIQALCIEKIEDDYLVIARNSFTLEIVNMRYIDFIKVAIEKKYGEINTIKTTVERNADTDEELKEQYQKDIINKIKNMQF